ncbi:hypothetical protein I3842_10G163300 [Carya illinoinensis]|uniref:Thioredoxin domain-containing protein n=1 Tax=Carya illinoinensis TaxID=32201 RepID=A0A922J3T6_CARIL|nr:hypothetical protein I3842_10G163300 [Carya illinoinensis]
MGLCLGKQTEGGDSEENVKFSGGNVHLITSKESWDQKLVEASGDGKIVIANFSATWCGPCKTMAPFYRELSEKYPSVVFLLIDVEELTVTIRPTAKLYQLTNMPNKSVIRKAENKHPIKK